LIFRVEEYILTPEAVCPFENSTKLYGITSQKIILFIVTAVRT
jgi:hypothetical protein